MIQKALLLLTLLLGGITTLVAQQVPVKKNVRYSISGHLKDANNGETLIGATVFVQETSSGTASNTYGFYSLSLPPGDYTLVYSFVGYESQTKKIHFDSNLQSNVELVPSAESLNEVVVQAEKKNQNLTRVEMGVEKLQPQQIKSIPALMGEVDLLKAIQMLPGVQSTSEGGSGFSVRGGTPDQNLILLDEATVYNASHLMGFFSVFNNDAINDLRLYKGDVPAQYGGRLSSLLDVRMKDGNSKRFSGIGGIGTISSRLTLEGPIKKDQTSFLVAGRRTYMDLFLPLANNENARDSKLYFYDMNLKFSHRINENNRLFLSGYLGRDVMKSPDFKMGFGNKTFTARWNHIFNQKLFLNLTGIWSRYDYELGTPENEPDSWLWDSSLEDLGLKADFSYYIKPENTLSFGLQSYYHELYPGSARGTGSQSVFTEYTVPRNYALEHAAYLSHQFTLGSKVTVKYGLRASLFQNVGKAVVYSYDSNYEVADSTFYGHGEVYKNYSALEPRIGINYKINNNWSVKFNYNRSTQFIQQASNTTAGSPLDIWFSASPNVKPQIADQFAAGAFRNFNNNNYQVSAEIYYKDMQNTIDFADHAELLLNKYLEGEIRTGSAKAYGLELLIKKTEGKMTGWIGYTLSRAERTIEGINDGKTFVAPYDKPHEINTVFNYEISRRVSFSANWLFATGQPVTLPVQRYELNGTIIPLYTERNGGRYEPYHRLDVSVTLQPKKNTQRKWKGEWVFSIYNLYNRKNTWSLSFKQDAENPNETYAEKIYLFPIIPSVTYNFKF
ncbi:MAG: TonB-dependent receptor [Mangrovibacterium sp.]